MRYQDFAAPEMSDWGFDPGNQYDGFNYNAEQDQLAAAVSEFACEDDHYSDWPSDEEVCSAADIAGGIRKGLVEAENASLKTDFDLLVRQWRKDTLGSSDVHERILHPAYLRIIGMGPRVLPLIFRELEKRLDLWFWALEALTGADPVPDGVDTMKEIRQAWLRYGRDMGLLRDGA